MLNLSLQRKLDRVDEIMFDTPGNYYIKDLHGRYIYLNQNSLEMIGDNTALGKTDNDLAWSEYARIYQEEDQLVLHTKRNMNFNQPIMNYKKEIFLGCTQKKPFFYQGRLIGVAGVSVEVPHNELSHSTALLQTQTYIDSRSKQKLVLSKRQQEVLHWILKGFSAREAAKKLHVSIRTIEHHVTNIREANDFCSLKELLLHVRAL